MDDYLEVKVKPGGEVRHYRTELLHRTPRLAIVRFLMRQGGAPPELPVVVPRGSVSIGFFWRARPYDLYRWRDPAGRLIAHRFDAVADVEIGATGIRYRDLVLDWWVLPGDLLIEEDRDEFELLAAAGELSPRDVAIAREADRQVHARFRHILDEADRLEQRHVPSHSG
jgi:hypothetical protein